MLLASVFFGITPIEHFSIAETLVGIHPRVDDYLEALRKFGTETNFEIYRMLVWINLMWGLVNLLPIWPLDGGQASQIILTKVNRAEGARWCHIVSLLVAGVLALLRSRLVTGVATCSFPSFSPFSPSSIFRLSRRSTKPKSTVFTRTTIGGGAEARARKCRPVRDRARLNVASN